MSDTSQSPGPSLETLFALFSGSAEAPEYSVVSASDVPQPYRRLLVHEHHMTIAMETHHGKPVYVRILQRNRAGSWYARKILLYLVGTDRCVQFGIMRINLDLCSKEVRQAILHENEPLGRILIRHNVLRRIEPTTYLRIACNPAFQKWFRINEPLQTYGRLAVIHCDDKPAVELLEIVAPERVRG